MDNMELWEKVKQAPPWALKSIIGGRLKGKSNIDPQWRIEALTEAFGPCGFGWYYTIDKLWKEETANGVVLAFAKVILFVKDGDEWSKGIEGIGGNQMVKKEASGFYPNDECYKMAVTDAISVCTKQLGLAADVYKGLFDGSKYIQEEPKELPKCEYISDDSGQKRYNVTHNTLNDLYQERLKLITTTDWRALQELSGDEPRLKELIYNTYGIEFYDIQIEMLPKLIKLVRDEFNETNNELESKRRYLRQISKDVLRDIK